MISVVVPTIRPESMQKFKWAWHDLFRKHEVILYEVMDGDSLLVRKHFYHEMTEEIKSFTLPTFPDERWEELIFNRTDACRNLGFLHAARDYKETRNKWTYPEVIMTVDDDVTPYNSNNPIQEHLNALFERCPRSNKLTPRYEPISWFAVASEYTRGFPYSVRKEAEVWVSHGVWEGVHDHDGPTQLVKGNIPMTFKKGPIPKGCLFPCSGMNLMFRMEALPYLYYAPMGRKLGVERFADIFMGTLAKWDLDELNKAFVTGYSTVYHERASSVLNNLGEEAKGIKWNENWWKEDSDDPDRREYFSKYYELKNKWKEVVREIIV